MRGVRFWVWMIAASLSITLDLPISSANVLGRSVLIVHSGDYPEVEQVRAELMTLGYEVMLLNDHQPKSASARLSEQLIAVTQENRAAVGVEFAVVGTGLQVWLYCSSRGTVPTVQHFAYAAAAGESEGADVLHVVEYLRATLMQGEARARVAELPQQRGPGPLNAAIAADQGGLKPEGNSAPASDHLEVGALALPTTDVKTLPIVAERPSYFPGRPPSLWLVLAPGVALMNKLSVPVPAIAGGLSWQVTPQFSTTLQGLLPITTSELSRSLATTDVTAVGLLGLMRYDLAQQDSRWRPLVGAGMTLFWVEKRYIVLAPIPSLEVGLQWQPRATWTLHASLLAGLPIWVSSDVRKKWNELWQMSTPAILFASFGVEWRAVAWGRRD